MQKEEISRTTCPNVWSTKSLFKLSICIIFQLFANQAWPHPLTTNISLDFIAVDPKFSSPIVNMTAPVGRDAFLTCVVQDLGPYKVSLGMGDQQSVDNRT